MRVSMKQWFAALTVAGMCAMAPQTIMAADAAKMTTAKTVNGQELKIDATSGVKINDAKVVTADVEASNGVIHIIDSVLMPAAAAKTS